MKQKIEPKGTGKKSTHKSPAIISPAKRRLFSLLVLLIPVFAFVLLEAGLRLFQYGENTELFVSTPDEASQYYGINLNVGKRYFYRSSFNPTPRKDLFLKEKPKNGYRIFVLGGSTTAGFPYGNNLTFTRILNRRLSDTFPDRRIEVVNTAMTAINSYALLDFMDEIIKQQPDALLIYAGHNEFYGALGVASMESLGKIGWVVRTFLKLQRFRTFVLVRDVIALIEKSIGVGSNGDVVKDPMETEMSRIVKDQTIPLHSSLYESGKNQFRSNLRSILQKSREAGIPVLISELVSNVRDQRPFTSIENDTLPSAKSVFERARTLESEGKYDEARKAYYLAKDLDALRFRAPEEFNEIIHSLAAEFAIPVVPMKSYFESASPNECIGDNLMNDHLHPKIDGYFLMADAFCNSMRLENLISSDWQKRTIVPSSYYRTHWGITPLDSVYAALTIIHLKGGWPFKKEGPNLSLYEYTPVTKEDSVALQILKTGSSTLELGHMELASYYEKRRDYERAFREYVALIYTVPNLDLFYEPALKILLSTRQYNRALALLEDALKYNESGFVYKWIGQIRLAGGDTQEGIRVLEKARLLLPGDAQLLFNLTRAYYSSSQFEKGDATLARLKSIAPNTAAIRELEAYKKSPRGLRE
jgi:tetratricopeptide (TPR) repeat protein